MHASESECNDTCMYIIATVRYYDTVSICRLTTIIIIIIIIIICSKCL